MEGAARASGRGARRLVCCWAGVGPAFAGCRAGDVAQRRRRAIFTAVRKCLRCGIASCESRSLLLRKIADGLRAADGRCGPVRGIAGAAPPAARSRLTTRPRFNSGSGPFFCAMAGGFSRLLGAWGPGLRSGVRPVVASGRSCRGCTVSAQVLPHLSPEQAAQAAGVSRWTILRAIKAGRLKAFRDNSGRWRIGQGDLQDWQAAQVPHSVRDGAAHSAAVASLAAEADLLRVKLLAAERARDAAEADRDAWRAVAQDLAGKRRRWLFW